MSATPEYTPTWEAKNKMLAERDATIAELRSHLALAQKGLELLDRIELGEGDTFDGTIAGGPPCDVDLFLPGPKYNEWCRSVLDNRRARLRAARSTPKRGDPTKQAEPLEGV